MKEDLAEWLNNLYPELYINVDNFWTRLDTGVALCNHANNVRDFAERYVEWRKSTIKCFASAKPGTFFARDNVSNFITWCRQALHILECLLFETDDLILLKNEKNVILCLLELARQGAKFGMPAPMLVLMEKEIDKEIARTNGETEEILESGSESDCEVAQAKAQIVTNDLKSLDDMVRVEIQMCKCPTQFPMIRVSEGKYRIGDTKVLIFVRLLRNHVMVRVGGGWDTLAHYLDKHDPCRCRTSHKSTVSSKITGMKSGGQHIEIAKAKVTYERKDLREETVWGARPYCVPNTVSPSAQ
ncbi:hypothetical protein O3M35_011581 [Rhynocoris fuscipes]|uniref:GAS2-like protein 1 n=1 Tax=Rhynocoris fuscipes TaxID=488301 RepID=A0AAW1CW94_9HEMI